MSKVTLKHLKVGYPIKRKDYKVIIDDLNLSFPDGKISVIIGESGCGKTSILRTITGILTPLEGTILFDDIEEDHLNGIDRIKTERSSPAVQKAAFSVIEGNRYKSQPCLPSAG